MLMSTILILSLPSFSPSFERARASRPAAARHDALLGGKSLFSTTHPAPLQSPAARTARKDGRGSGRGLAWQLGLDLAGGLGGTEECRLPCSCNQDLPRTSSDASAHTLIGLAQVLGR